MAAAKGGFTLNFLNYNTAQENNASNDISGPAPLPPTPLLHEKNNFTSCMRPSEIIELVDDEVQSPRDPHQHVLPGRLHQTPSVIPPNQGVTPRLMPTPTGRINRPDVSSLNSKMLPEMRPYQHEPLLGRVNQSGLHFSNNSGSGFPNDVGTYTGSPSISDLLGIGRGRSDMGSSNFMTTPQRSTYGALQQQSTAHESNIHFSTCEMPPYSRQLKHTSAVLDSDLSSLNFGMLPQPGSLLIRPDSRTLSDMGFPSSVMSHLTGSLHSEPHGSTNELDFGFPNMAMPHLTNSSHAEHRQSSTTESGMDSSFSHFVAPQPQMNLSQNSIFLTTSNAEPSSTLDMPPQGSGQEKRPNQEMVPTEEVATNQVTPDNQGIEFNKTPQQKSRRKKYVPKVVKKPRAPKKTTTPKKPSEDRPKRRYVRKKVVEPPPVETPVNANGDGKPAGNSTSFIQNNVNLQSNPVTSPLSCTQNTETVQGTLAEVSIPCTPNITAGLNNPINVSSPCTPKSVQGANTMGHTPNYSTLSSMNKPHKSVRRCLNFDAEDARLNGQKGAPQNNLSHALPPSGRMNASIATSAVQTSPSPSKGITLDLNSSPMPWQEEFDRLFPPAPSVNTGGTNLVFGTGQTTGTTASNVNAVPGGLRILTDYPCPQLSHQTNSSTVAPTTPVNQRQMAKYQKKLAAIARNNGNLNLESLTNGTVVPSNSYSNAPSIISDGRKRDYSTLLRDTGLTSQVSTEFSPDIVEAGKKMKIWNGNNTGQDGTIHNASSVINSSSTLLSVRPDSRVFSLADAQRLIELRKRSNAKMLSSKIPDRNTEKGPHVSSIPVCTSSATVAPSNYQVMASDDNWSACAVNMTLRDQIYQSGVSIQTSAERTATLNQYVNTSGTELCRPITPSVNRVTLEILTGTRCLDATSTQSVDPIIQPHAANGAVRNESCQIGPTTQTVSEITTEKPVTNIYTPPSTPAKFPISNAPSKSEPKRRGRPPKSEKTGPNPQVPPLPKGRPRGKKSSPNSTNHMVNDPAALAYILDLIIEKLSGLDINRVSQIGPGQQCYALVPYQSGVGDGAIVPFGDGMVKKKKRKSRAQVILDPVTSQVWNLLMGKEMKDGIDTVTENDEKVMEGEREVFRGRVDSFIARMHLVQGDRRFSPWKGSVVDSVVGVFLTQNVSDHLSSSAFMALVAKYPLKTQLKNSLPRESTLIVSRPCNTNPYARDFIDLTKWHRQSEVIIEDFTEIGSQVTSEEKDSNDSQGSTSKCPSNSLEKKLTGSPDSGPGLVINFSSEDPATESVISSHNSVVSNQSSPDYLFQTGERNLTGLGMFGNYSADEHVGNISVPDFIGTRPTSYTQLLRMAESNEVDFSSDLNKEAGTAVDCCSYSNISQIYQSRNNYSGTSSTINNAHMSRVYPQNLVFSPSVAPAVFNGNKNIETFQTQDSEPTIRNLHSPMVSRTEEAITPIIKITTTSAQAYIPVQQEKNLYQVESTQSPVEQPHHQAQSTRSASQPQNSSDANTNKNSQASSVTVQGKQQNMGQKVMDGTVIDDGVSSKGRKGKGATGKSKKNFDWDSLRRAVCPDGVKKERTYKTMDSLDYEALRNASVNELSDAIRERGMNNMLAERIKGFLDRVVKDHGSIDLEWLRDVDPGKAKDYLLSIRGLGLKSVECVRLLTLHHMAFPVDTNVGRICVRLGWVPLQPLPESLQLHLLEMYPILENIQKYLWPRLCKLDQRTLYELHYQMITFGKVFCTKSKPNCNACPMRAECKHFASAFASARLALPAPEEKGLSTAALPSGTSTSTNLQPPFPPHAPPPEIEGSSTTSSLPLPLPYPSPVHLPFHNRLYSQIQPQLPNPTLSRSQTQTCNEPIIEEPASPEPEPVAEKEIGEIEDAFVEDDPDEIPVIKLDFKEFTQNLRSYFQANNLEIEGADMSKAMVAISPEAASIPVPKLKNVSRLRTEHQVYELPDNHTLLNGFEPREPDDPSPYLLSIWTPGETAMSTEPPKSLCISQGVDELCDKEACARCASIKESRSKIVRGTILIPCRTAMRGSFPLNGTYFQVNEVFADHDSSRTPIELSRSWIWNLPRRTVYFGTSIPTIFKGQSTEEIQHCFWRGFVCVRGFDRATRAPRPLYARLHFPASKVTKNGKRSAAAKDEE
ncbi:demeter-like protein 3 [Rhynchospora pubera]|uniref:Demeter-like protein 3 n=1 Tax=Rhynchospora pubera TaxID=906938 RepID=A0AAV8DD59_9POAL|nr:demeter-like protein 3 [Rhynchospora pubera]